MAFIGIDNLTHVKDRLQGNIILGPAYYSEDELKRMAIKVITGVEFKDTATIFNRKGGTARRKVVGQSQNSNLGYLTERTLEAHIVWDHYTANEDDFKEKPVQITINGSAQPSFPKTEEFINQIGIAFNDNVFPCLWHGDEASEKPEMALFNGFHADLDKDIANGDVSEANGNLIPCAVLDGPATEGDSAAWDEFVSWYNKWHPALKRRETIVYMSTAYGNYIADAYEQKHRSHQAVQFIPDANGNFKVREYPKVTFCPSDDFGDGTRMIATIPFNMEMGVNSEADQSFVSIMHGDPTPGGDHKTITFQIQGVFGTRILRINAANFVTNGGTIEDKYWSGDYQKDSFTVVANNDAYGTVSVSPAATNGEYAKGTTLTITATPKTGYRFVKWQGASNATTATANVVTKGQPESAVAIFEATT
ncbi:MAG: hypothetical protein IKR31_03220 [Prevotella sp.]|nr:hypothetical protein [Prevotella sp.]